MALVVIFSVTLLLMSTVIICRAGEDESINPNDIQIETKEIGDCRQKAQKDNFITIHFKGYFEDGTPISSTHERGVPVELQLGSKMLSSGLDQGLTGMCVGEKRKIVMSPDLGLLDLPNLKAEGRKVVYDVELLSVSQKTTVNTFNYLDLDGDKKISSHEAESLVQMFMKALTTTTNDWGIDIKTLVSFFMSLHDKDSDGFISAPEFMDSVHMNEQVLGAFGGHQEL